VVAPIFVLTVLLGAVVFLFLAKGRGHIDRHGGHHGHH
jgi:hypothetical protein